MFDADVRALMFLSNEEIVARTSDFVDIDRDALKQSVKHKDIVRAHRRFTDKTGIVIKNTHLWLQCMTHASFKEPQIDKDDFICTDPNYERIEFLGDAVLQLLSSSFLVDALPHHQEGLLSNVRSSLVKNKRLAVVARQIGFEDFVRLGKQVGNLYVDDVLADVYEATLGAIFLENAGDLRPVRAVLEKTLFPRLSDAIRRREWMTSKHVFSHHINEWNRMDRRQTTLSFKKLRVPASSASHANGLHAVGLYVNNVLVARACGRTISAAQEAACREGLRRYGLTLHEE